MGSNATSLTFPPWRGLCQRRGTAAASCDKRRQMSKKMPQQDATAMNEVTGL